VPQRLRREDERVEVELTKILRRPLLELDGVPSKIRCESAIVVTQIASERAAYDGR